MLLVRSDVSAGNSLSVPQLTAVRSHYPYYFRVRSFWNKLIWFGYTPISVILNRWCWWSISSQSVDKKLSCRWQTARRV